MKVSTLVEIILEKANANIAIAKVKDEYSTENKLICVSPEPGNPWTEVEV